MKEREIIIVGAGPAGCAAAAQCARLGVKPLLLDRTGYAGGLVENAFSVENYPLFAEPPDGPGFVRMLRGHIARFGVSVEKTCVRRVRRSGERYLATSDSGEIRAGCLIMAAGSEPVKLGIPGEAEWAGARLFYEVRHLAGNRPGRVIVAGGGEAAFDYALSLAKWGWKVDIIHRGGTPAARGRLRTMAMKTPGIRIHANARPVSFEDNGGEAALVAETNDGARRFATEAVIVAIGRKSAAASIIPDVETETSGYPTSPAPGLFIVGDAARGALGQAGTAIGDGLAAAASAVAFLEKRGLR